MAHFTRRRTSWPRGYAPTGDDLKDIDVRTTDAVNGDGGGTYTPSAPIEIEGAGVGVTGLWTFYDDVVVEPAGAARFVFDKNTVDDAFVLRSGHNGRARSYVEQCAKAFPARTTDVTTSSYIRSRFPGARIPLPFRTLNGATLATLNFRFSVGESHADVPAQLPRFRVIRVSDDGAIASLRAMDATTSVDGFQSFVTPASGAAWYDSGNIQTYLYTCNQNNVIDVEAYSYLAEFVDEDGSDAWSTAGNAVTSLVASYTGLPYVDSRD